MDGVIGVRAPAECTASEVSAISAGRRLVAGVILLLASWSLAWVGPSPYAWHTFFPLWLGYIMTVDALTLRRTGTSLLNRSPGRFVLLFAFSIPLWWLFERCNRRLGNWSYLLPDTYTPLAYGIEASIAFSTVMPAILVTAEFYRSFPFFARPFHGIRLAPSRRMLVGIASAGMAMFLFSLLAPRQGFPFVWIGLFFFIDPINALLGARSISVQVAARRWDTVIVLFAAGLTCGFFWEMWNYWSMPKWLYHVPYVDGAKLFEMPILGYGGYLPFALEIYAAYHLLHHLIFRRLDSYLTFDNIGAVDRCP